MKFPRKRLVALAVTAALALTGCAAGTGGTGSTGGAAATDGAAATGAAGGGTITAGVAYETTNYNPSNTASALALGANWHVVEGLYNFDMTDYSVHPGLAADEDLTQVSDTEYEVALRADAKFSDGTPVTAADVVESFNRATAEGNIYGTLLPFFDSAVAKDDTTVTLKLKNPYSLLKERLTLVKIVPAAMTEEQLTSMPVGSGPWKYESITDTQITAVPNEHYNGSNPATAERMEWSILKDDTARATALQDGSIAIMEAVPANDVQRLEAAGMAIEKKDGFNNPFLLFNTTKAPFDKPEVRQAFHYAIDTQKLIDNNLAGEAKAATSFLPESNPAYHKAATQFDYNPEKAKELLAAAGAENLNITLISTDHPWISQLTPQIKQDLEAVGVTVNVQSLASASLYADNLDVDTPTFDVALAPGDPSVFGNDPALLISWWYGDNAWQNKRSFWKQSDAESFNKIQELLAAGASGEGADAQAAWDEALDLIAEKAPIYPLFHRTMITAYNPELVDGVTAIGTTGLSMLKVTVK